MPLHLLIAPDSFKACLSASALAQAMAEGVRSVVTDATLSLCPLSDGGEGLTDVLAARRPHNIIYSVKNTAPLSEIMRLRLALTGYSTLTGS